MATPDSSITPLAAPTVESDSDRLLRQNKQAEKWRATNPEADTAHHKRNAEVPVYLHNEEEGKTVDKKTARGWIDRSGYAPIASPAWDANPEHFNQSLEKMHGVVKALEGGTATAEHLYRSYKSSPHRPAAVLAKYIVHRLNHADEYEEPQSGHEQDKKFLAMAQMGGASRRNGHLSVHDLHEWVDKNPQLVKDVIDHRDAVQRDILQGVGLHVRTINGAPHVALTRGLNGDIMTMEHPLSSWADVPETGFGQHMHYAWVPVKDVWFAFPHFRNDYSGGEHENEYLVSSSRPKYEATVEDIKQGNPSKYNWSKGELWKVPTGPRRDDVVRGLSDSATDRGLAGRLKDEIDTGGDWKNVLKHKNAGPLTWQVLSIMHPNGAQKVLDSKAVPREVAIEALKNRSGLSAIKNPNLSTDDLIWAANGIKTEDPNDYEDILDHPNSDSRVAKAIWDRANKADLDDAETMFRALARHHTTPPEALQGIIDAATNGGDKDRQIVAGNALKGMYENPHLTEEMAGQIWDWQQKQGKVSPKLAKHAPLPARVIDKMIADLRSDDQYARDVADMDLTSYGKNPRATPENLLKIVRDSPQGMDVAASLVDRDRLDPAVMMWLAKHDVRPHDMAQRSDLTPEVVAVLALNNGWRARDLLFRNKHVKPEWLRAAWPKSEQLPTYEKEEDLNQIMGDAQDPKTHLGYAIQAREAYAKRRLRDHIIKPLPEGVWKSEENPADLMFRAEIEHWLAQKESQNLGWLAVVPEENIHDIVEHNVLHPQPNERLLEGKAVVVQPNRPHILEALHHGLQPGEVVVRFSADQDPRPYGPGQFFFPDTVAVQEPEVLASNLRKDEKDPLVDLNLMNEEQVEEWELEMAATMLGENPVANKALAAAHFMARNHEPDFERYSLALRVFQDFNRAALYAYQIPDTEENLRAIAAVQKVGGKELAKAEAVAQKVSTVVPVMPEAAETAQELRRAAAAGLVKPLKLNGRHSKGAMAAKDPRTKHTWLLKPGN